jgi:HlyD family secretion protein
MLEPTINNDLGNEPPAAGVQAGSRTIRDTSATDVAIESTQPKRRRIIIGATAAVLGITGTIAVRAWMTTGVGIPRERVRIAEVTRGMFVRDVAAEGTVVAANSPTLYAIAAGTVTFTARAAELTARRHCGSRLLESSSDLLRLRPAVLDITGSKCSQ